MSSAIIGLEFTTGGVNTHPSQEHLSSYMPRTVPDGDDFVRCARCGHVGCDVKVAPCGCCFHAVSSF